MSDPMRYNKNYIGYEKLRLDKMETDYSILDVMELFLDYVNNSDDNYLPKEKIKGVVSDFLSDQNIPHMNVVAEDEVLMLDRWTKSVNGDDNE